MSDQPSSQTAGEVTRLLHAARAGDSEALERVFPLIYDDLRRAAQRVLRRERPDHTLQATELVHDAFLRLAGHVPNVQHRAHFLAIAARAMRQVLVDHARRRGAAKRGGEWVRTTLGDDVGAQAGMDAEELLALDDALARLEAHDKRLRAVVEYRFFGGLTEKEIADALGVTERTVQRDWVRARAWLHKELGTSGATK